MAYRKRQAAEKASSKEALNDQEEKTTKLSSPDDAIDQQLSVIVFSGLYRLIHEPVEAPVIRTNAAVPSSSTNTTPAKDSPLTKAASSTAVASGEKHSTKGKFAYRLKPIYWEGDSLYVTRGTWFFEASGGDWQPLDADGAEFVQKIEDKHLNIFANQRIPDRPVYFEKGPRPVLCELPDADEEKCAGSGASARWHSVVDVLLVNKSRSSRLWQYLTGAVTKLKRGYHTLASLEDGPAPVTHLVFVIHGIGQKRQRNRIVLNTTCIREIAEQLLRANFPSVDGRPMFLPVDWRNELQLDEELIAGITPNYLQSVRGFFNETLLDLLYYASPIYGPKVIQGMCKVLNRMYQLYLSNDPDFEARGGRVSLAAHSLGSVITYDIVTGGGQGKVTPPGEDNRITIMPGVDTESSRLIFPVAHLFCFGSPLGVFLAARHIRGLRIIARQENGSTPDSRVPDVSFKLHNIYHPADPVAYRIEPLISEIYADVKPLRIHSYHSSNQTPYEDMPAEVLSSRTSVPRSRLTSGDSIGGKDPSILQLSDSEDNLSGFESDDGPSVAVAKQTNAPVSSPPTKRSWGAAVFGRLGIGARSGKENVEPRAASPLARTAVDGELKPDRSGGGEEVNQVKCSPEEAKEAVVESYETLTPKGSPEEKKSSDKTTRSNKEKKADATVSIPPGQALPYRVDYMLKPGRLDYAIVAAIMSHISYWSNHDVILYLLQALYGNPESFNHTSS